MTHDRRIALAETGPPLLATAYRGLAPLVRDLRALDTALRNLLEAGDETTAEAVRALRRALREFEPAVTLIGQVKAGKTTLANALAGGGGLLPADINPWTSVVTSLHLSPALKPANQRARFRFFSEAEWAHLLTTGGRVGELASRAGADRELDKVRRQLAEMRAKSRKRLGPSFEQLLGQSHDYGYVDAELVQRYVCLGDDFDLDTSTDQVQGRFADITRSADLHVSAPALPMPLCLRDTPGVNDTFMVREQITVNAIRGSRLCVVVLSAHQALSTVDLALVRLIANIPARQVVIFVNRIDELAAPARDIPEIRAAILATLAAQGVSTETEIVFGSAVWAQHALSRDLAALDRASAEALLDLAEHQAGRMTSERDPISMVWALSGLPALGQAIAARIVAGEGAERVAAIAGRARNIAGALAAGRAMVERRGPEAPASPADPAALARALDDTLATAHAGLAADLDALLAALEDRLAASRASFVSRAVAAMIEHLEQYGEDIVWTYDPSGLRVLLRSGYQVFATKAARAAEARFQACATALREVFLRHSDLSDIGFEIEAPSVPPPPAPVLLGQTIALDIRGSWWTRWWRRRRSYAQYSDEFRALIDAEIAPMAEGLKGDLATGFRTALLAELDGFVATQRALLMTLATRSQADLDGLRRQASETLRQRQAALTEARAVLGDFTRPEARKASA